MSESKELLDDKKALQSAEVTSINSSSEDKVGFVHNFNLFKSEHGELADFDTTDPVLTEKIRLINDALDEIGFTWYQFKLFILNGMGYSVDSQLTLVQSSVATYVQYQFKQTYPSDTHALYAGMLVGALFWGFGADLIGRKFAFNSSLMLSAIFAIMAGTMGNWGTYCAFVALSAAASGGNLVLDSTVFLEFLPSKQQWLVTFMAAWWSLGQTLAVLSAWLFFSIDRFYCDSMENCPAEGNRGWRYIWFVNGGFVLIIAILRLTVIKLKETPKFLVSNHRDAEAVQVLQDIAKKYNRTCSLTLEHLQACGEITAHNYYDEVSLKQTYKTICKHCKTLFSSRKMALSTTLVFVSWTLLGISYPLYTNFLPELLAARGAQTSANTLAGVYRDNIIPNAASTGGSVIAGLILYVCPLIGRRGTMAIGGLVSMALFFGYTAVTTRAQNVGLSSAVYVAIYIYYACLYAYTPEVMPSSARATGNALAVSLTRAMGIIVPVIAYFGDTSSSVPVWVCGACVGVIGMCSLFMPFEPSLQRVG